MREVGDAHKTATVQPKFHERGLPVLQSFERAAALKRVYDFDQNA
ncbi:MAG: hypothetical protein ACKVT1_02370 [Dehalococcoidia bacterium]